MVVTRSLTEDASISRVRILGIVRDLFEDNFETSVFRIRSIIDAKRAGDWVSAAWRMIAGFVIRKPAPLQCVLFSASSEIRRLTREISGGRFDVVYLDSVRTWSLLKSLRRENIDVRVVVDFDDLMSRRMEMLSQNGWAVSLGYLKKRLPRWVQEIVEGWFSGVIANYEARALRYVEQDMCADAQAITLVSPVEADLLRRQLPPGTQAEVCSVIPSRPVAVTRVELRSPYRFVFIGSDVHGQNRLSLEFLVELWRRIRPLTRLHVYGRQNSAWPDVENIVWHGYVDDLSEVYSEDSIAVLPALRAGGIKTKMIEAWAYGRPVLANPTAFEGLSVSGYPLIVPEAEWDAYVRNPEFFERHLWDAANIGNSFVKEELSEEAYVTQWRGIMWPALKSKKGG
jgi:glycosyltransferase involved in cell wall biosynthesis